MLRNRVDSITSKLISGYAWLRSNFNRETILKNHRQPKIALFLNILCVLILLVTFRISNEFEVAQLKSERRFNYSIKQGYTVLAKLTAALSTQKDLANQFVVKEPVKHIVLRTDCAINAGESTANSITFEQTGDTLYVDILYVGLLSNAPIDLSVYASEVKPKSEQSSNNPVSTPIITPASTLFGLPPQPFKDIKALGQAESQLCSVIAGFALTIAVLLLERRGSNRSRIIKDEVLYRASISIFVLVCGQATLASCLALLCASSGDFSRIQPLLHANIGVNFALSATFLFYGVYVCLIAARHNIEHTTARWIWLLASFVAFIFQFHSLFTAFVNATSLATAIQWSPIIFAIPGAYFASFFHHYRHLKRSLVIHDETDHSVENGLWKAVSDGLARSNSIPDTDPKPTKQEIAKRSEDEIRKILFAHSSRSYVGNWATVIGCFLALTTFWVIWYLECSLIPRISLSIRYSHFDALADSAYKSFFIRCFLGFVTGIGLTFLVQRCFQFVRERGFYGTLGALKTQPKGLGRIFSELKCVVLVTVIGCVVTSVLSLYLLSTDAQGASYDNAAIVSMIALTVTAILGFTCVMSSCIDIALVKKPNVNFAFSVCSPKENCVYCFVKREDMDDGDDIVLFVLDKRPTPYIASDQVQRWQMGESSNSEDVAKQLEKILQNTEEWIPVRAQVVQLMEEHGTQDEETSSSEGYAPQRPWSNTEVRLKYKGFFVTCGLYVFKLEYEEIDKGLTSLPLRFAHIGQDTRDLNWGIVMTNSEAKTVQRNDDDQLSNTAVASIETKSESSAK
ncbi:MAG TPA: hypothetical protein VK171_10700 [Fimbriimonas sp.]|nr:hypothetical protein [Fimbriimonas sp.]